MDAIGKTIRNGESTTDINAIMSDIASLKQDLAALAGHLKDGAVSAGGDAAGQLSGEAKRVLDVLSAQGSRGAKAIGQQVEEQPVLTLLLAFAVGFVGGRLLAR
jgi:ElaB/YqjD/DUF883 family membrane-anchored ribosome-binding protein